MSGGPATGWLLLDKPAGPSSAQAVACVRRLYDARRAGHAGTLDPLADGLLAVALGAATRWSGYLLDAAKTYRFTLRLGIESPTQDAEGFPGGAPAAAAIPALGRGQVEALLARFTGRLRQTPPMHSALRFAGRRLYDLARRGRTVPRPARTVEVESLALVAQREEEWDLEVRCSKGTYVRTLGHDLGRALGCGGYVSALRRTAIGGLEVRDAVSLEWLEAAAPAARLARLLPADAVLPDWPELACDGARARALAQGRAVACDAAAGAVRLRGPDGAFLGVGEADGAGWLRPRRLMPLE